MSKIVPSNKIQTDLKRRDMMKGDKDAEAQSLEDLLLNAPTLTDDEIQEFGKIREWMSQWNVNDQ